jgi:3-oxoacyl-[acyl-carrier-protein] synthase-1
VNTGLVTSVGLSSPASCAAIRAAISNNTETRFRNAAGEWIVAAQVSLEQPWRGRAKLVKMLRLAIEECLASVDPPESSRLPLLLCVAELDRPGRLEGLDDELCKELEFELGAQFHQETSGTIPYGRVSVALALARARELIYDEGFSRVLVAATDSLIVNATLARLEAEGRLLSASNSDGLIPGEAAGAILVQRDLAGTAGIVCAGLGFAEEAANIVSEQPLRGHGLTNAIKLALFDAGCELHDLDFRITDLSGEHYYFKEASLALSRTLRARKDEFPLWHPADCIGETGAASGLAALTVALVACQKAYATGPNLLFHAGNDGGRRAAAVLRYEAGV